MKKEVLMDIILWYNDEPKEVLSKEISAGYETWVLFGRIKVWKRKCVTREN